MKLKLILTTAIVGLALTLPSASSAATSLPPPTQGSVLLTGPVLVMSDSGFVLYDIDATSGPSGENPTGRVRFDVLGGVLQIGGPVTCLAVNGNTATINFLDEMDFSGIVSTVQVVDDQPDTFDAFPTHRAPTDCSPLAPTPGKGPLSSGDITAVDAQPLPTSKDECKNGGWRNFPQFKNQGQCIAFVERGP